MTTPRNRSFVSFAAGLALTLAVGACASSSARPDSEVVASVEPVAATIRFDNEARTHVHVYLVGARREWLLGRVEPGARATLRVPDEALDESMMSMQIVVVAGAPASLSAASDTRATTTIRQPRTELLSQRWSYSQTGVVTRLMSLPAARPRVEVGRP